MKVILVRHADAVAEGPGRPDPHRHLSAEGRAQALAVGRALRPHVPSLVLSSPLARALQTAELLVRGAEAVAVVEVLGELATSASVRAVEQHLRGLSEAVLVVGHEPGISGLAAVLTGVPSYAAFGRAQALLIEDGRAVWTIHPGDEAPRSLR